MYIHRLYGNSRLSTVSCLVIRPQVLYFAVQLGSASASSEYRDSLKQLDDLIQNAVKQIWTQKFISAMVDGSKDEEDLFVDHFKWQVVEDYSEFMSLVKHYNKHPQDAAFYFTKEIT